MTPGSQPFERPRYSGTGQGTASRAKRARQLGEQTGTPVYVLKRGKIVDITQERRKREATR